MSVQHLTPSAPNSSLQETASHTPTQSLLASLRSPISSLEILEDYLIGILAALDIPFRAVSKTPTNISYQDVLPVLPTIHYLVLNNLLPTWLTPLRDAGRLHLVRQLFCPSKLGTRREGPATLTAVHHVETCCKIVMSALPTILLQFPKLSNDPGPTAILDFCFSLLEEISIAYPIDVIHRGLFSPNLDEETVPDIADDHRMREWEDYIRTACSVPGKVANSLQGRTDIISKDALEHGPYFAGMSISAERLIFETSQGPLRGMSSLSQSLLLKYINLGLFPSIPPSLPSQPSFFASALPTIRGRLELPGASTASSTRYKETWGVIVRALPSTSQQTLLTSLLSALDCGVGMDTSSKAREKVRDAATVLRGLLGTPVGGRTDLEIAGNEQLWSALTANVCGPGWTRDIGVLRAVIRWLAEPHSRENRVNEAAVERLLDATLTTWTDPEYIRHSLLSQHRYTTSLFLLILASLPNTSGVPERLALSQPFIACITTYLGHLDKLVRRCGMLVAEVVATRCGKKLAFGGWEDASADAEWVTAMRTWRSDWIGEDDFDLVDLAKLPSVGPIASASPRPPPLHEADTYDSDDSLTGYGSPSSSSRGPSPTPSELAEFEQEPSLRVGRRKPISRPVYLAQLAVMLRPDRNADEGEAERLSAALAHAEGLIRRKKGFGLELEENAVELAISLLGLHDNYELPGFEEQRQAALTALVACCPQKAALTLIQQFFTNQYAVVQRVAALQALALGARELASLPVPPAQQAQQSAFPSKMLPLALHRRYATREQGRVQRLVEDISKNALTQSAAESATPLVRERQLRVGRLGSARVTSPGVSEQAQHGRERAQMFADVAAEHFVMPLVNHMWRHLRGTQGQRSRAGAGIVLGPVVLSQFLGTLAVLLHAARYASAYLVVLAPDSLELALVLGRQSAMGEPCKDEDEDETDAAVLTAALEVVLVVLDACIGLDGGRELGLQRTVLLLAVGEWARGVFEMLEQGQRIRGGGGVAEDRVGRAAVGVALKVEQITDRWGRAMVGL